MATQTVSTIDGVLKRKYAPFLSSMLNKSVPAFDIFSKKRMALGGTGAGLYWGVVVARPGAAGAIAEGGATPIASSGGVTQGTTTAKEIVSTLRFSNLAAAASKGKDALASVLQLESQRAMNALKRSVNRQIYGNKVSTDTTTWTSGKLALVNGAIGGGGSTSIVYDDGSATHFFPGQTIKIGSNYGVVVSVTPSSARAGTVVIAAATTASDNDVISVGESGGVASLGYEMTGLDAIARSDDDNLFGIDTGDNPQWAGIRSHNSGTARPLTSDLVNAFVAAPTDKTGLNFDYLLCHSSVQRQLVKLLAGDVRYEPLKLKGGFDAKVLSWTGDTTVPVISDNQCPLGKLYGVNTSEALCMGELLPLGFIEDDKGAILQRVSGTTSKEAVFGGAFDLVAYNRAGAGMLDDISIDVSSLTLSI